MSNLVLIFRDPGRGGNSVEELYHGLAKEWKGKLNITFYNYNDQKSVFRNIRAIQQLHPDIVHVTSDIYFIIPFFLTPSKIITIHDIGRYKELKGLKRLVYLWCWLKIPVWCADKVITVSDYTGQDIVNYVSHSAKQKIVRIYNPVPRIFKPAAKEEKSFLPILLQVGTLHYKNVDRIIEAVSDIPCHLIIVGRLSGAQQALVKQYHIACSNYPKLDYPEVYQQYIKADVVLFVSLHEGFGMPIIEANAVGRPVICSSTSSLPEIAGDAAVFVQDETSVVEIRSRILQLLRDESLQKNLVQAGYRNAERFKMENIAYQYLAVYNKYIS